MPRSKRTKQSMTRIFPMPDMFNVRLKPTGIEIVSRPDGVHKVTMNIDRLSSEELCAASRSAEDCWWADALAGGR